jgi:hypothetical protein
MMPALQLAGAGAAGLAIDQNLTMDNSRLVEI